MESDLILRKQEMELAYRAFMNEPFFYNGKIEINSSPDNACKLVVGIPCFDYLV